MNVLPNATNNLQPFLLTITWSAMMLQDIKDTINSEFQKIITKFDATCIVPEYAWNLNLLKIILAPLSRPRNNKCYKRGLKNNNEDVAPLTNKIRPCSDDNPTTVTI